MPRFRHTVMPSRVGGRIAIVLAAASLALTACGASSGGAGTGGNKEISLGWLSADSGSYAQYGRTMREGAEIAVDEINAAGGVTVGGTKYTFKLNTQDSESNPQQAVTILKKFVDEDNLNIILGLNASTEAQAVQPYWATKPGKLLISTDTTYRGSLYQHDNAFRVSGAQTDLDLAAVEYAKEQHVSSIAILSDANQAGLVQTFNDTIKAFKDAGINVVYQDTYPNDLTTDFYSTITKISSSKPDMVYMRSIFQAPLIFAKQAKELNFRTPVIENGSSAPDQVLKIVSPADVEGMAVVSNLNTQNLVDLGTPGAPEFVDKFTKKYHEQPGLFSVNGYAGIKILAAAMEAAGTTSDVGKLQKTLESMPIPPGVILPVVAWPGGHLFGTTYRETKIAVGVSQWKDGQLKTIKAVTPNG